MHVYLCCAVQMNKNKLVFLHKEIFLPFSEVTRCERNGVCPQTLQGLTQERILCPISEQLLHETE